MRQAGLFWALRANKQTNERPNGLTEPRTRERTERDSTHEAKAQPTGRDAQGRSPTPRTIADRRPGSVRLPRIHVQLDRSVHHRRVSYDAR